MRRVSYKVFFTIMWRGLCQAFGWFFGLFGYRRDGKFAKCVWGIFSLSAAIIMAILAFAIAYTVYDEFVSAYRYSHRWETTGGQYVSTNLSFIRDYNNSDGYIIDNKSCKKILKGVEWIAMPAGNDSLVCFSDGHLRGYFSKHTGKVIIAPKYKHAWIFSDGIASVEEDGKIKFIDTAGRVLIDKGIVYDEHTSGYVFHGGYCIISDTDNEKYGLMDRTGRMVLPMEYSSISSGKNYTYWSVSKNGQTAVYDINMNLILPFIDGTVYLTDGSIDVTMNDCTMRKYDYDGRLINDFYITEVRSLEYETDEIYYKEELYTEDGENKSVVSEKRKTAVARLRAYGAGGKYG